jgi:uncharacterized protein (DUF924 family)
MSETSLHKAVLDFWVTAGPESWFAKNDAFDRAIRDQFEPLHHAAARGELDDWAAEWDGALALLLLLDQFPRNLFRHSAHAYATDGMARRIALEAIKKSFDHQAPMPLRIFFYLPLEHAEDMDLQTRCVGLMEATGNAEFAKWSKVHRDIIEQFGRFPHRNTCLGRSSTHKELDFMADGGFAG